MSYGGFIFYAAKLCFRIYLNSRQSAIEEAQLQKKAIVNLVGFIEEMFLQRGGWKGKKCRIHLFLVICIPRHSDLILSN